MNHHLDGVAFAKAQGTGNDFVMISDADAQLLIVNEDVRAICDRHFGVGADGLIRAVRSRSLLEGQAILAEDPQAEWFMDYFNADGSIAQMCGNGVRAFVHYLRAEGLVQLSEGDVLAVGTRDGVKRVAVTADGYAVDMGRWQLEDEAEARTVGSDSIVQVSGLDVARPGLSISMGNPHTVVALAEQSELVELNLTNAPVVQPTPPHGSNVEFALPREPLVHEGVAEISMRVHERGVGETYSCGTGACAAAAATRFWAGAGAPAQWRVNVPGGVLGVRFFAEPGEPEHVELSGPAVLVFRGVL